MFALLESGMRIVNIDESWINDTTYFYKLWTPKHEACTFPMKPVSPRVSVIAAIDTDGKIWYSLTQETTNSEVFCLFLKHLIEQLDDELGEWRSNTAFLLDGARYHTSEESRIEMAKMGLRIIYTAGYSYTSSPIERLFAAMKRGELNPTRKSLGRK